MDNEMSRAATELSLYVQTDGRIYIRYTLPIVCNLMRKVHYETYDRDKALKLANALMEAGAKSYTVEHCSPDARWFDVFTPNDRRRAAIQWLSEFEVAAESGEYDEYINP